MYLRTDRRNVNARRTAVEEALRAAGLVVVAGGTRFTYYGRPGQDRLGHMVRVGVKAFRHVKRWQSLTGIQDMALGKEHYHGKVPIEKIGPWALLVVAKNDGPGVDSEV